MARFLFRRLAGLLLTLAIAALLIFAVLEILPGDPAATMLGVSATPETMAALRRDLGLDQPAMIRFWHWIGGIFTGDLGLSYAYRVPVAGLIAERFPLTMPLALLALLLATLIGVPLGSWAAARAHGRVDVALMGVTQLGLAIPNFWFGILFILLFAVGWRWFPAGGFPGWAPDPLAAFRALLLPALALALPQAASLARITRSTMLDTLNEDYIRTARAKGLTRGQTLRRHALRNALIPVLTLLGLQFSFLLAGTIVLENVFALPGLGRLLIQAIGGHDLPLIRNLVLFYVATAVIVNVLVDLAYGLADPRLRVGRA
jgi:peptide/nickel transport system permease protein